MFTKQYGFQNPHLAEGGSSRLNAILELCKVSGTEQVVYRPSNIIIRVYSCAHFLISLSRCSNEVILVHYSIFASLLSHALVTNFVFMRLLRTVLNRVTMNNRLFIEVNDLPYEQAIDLELPHNRMNAFDDLLFRLRRINFIFASVGMSHYICATYDTPWENCSVLINGGPAAKSMPTATYQSSCLSFVYAGTLNQGRQIEEMMLAFEDSHHRLYLLGENGNWIENFSYKRANIIYLGALDEERAHEFVSTCDVGLIPYDQSRSYYNMCYPTKASFYVTAGIPFLSTELTELKHHFGANRALFYKLEDWKTVISESDFPSTVSELKPRVRSMSADFQWQKLWNTWITDLPSSVEKKPIPMKLRSESH